MKTLKYIIFIAFCIIYSMPCKAQTDTIDILHYTIRLDIGNRLNNKMCGSATLRMKLETVCDSITLDMKPSDIDSVIVANQRQGYNQRLDKLHIPVTGIIPNQPFDVTIYYTKGEYVENYNWGGFHFDNNIHYNLGVAFKEFPHNFGRSWYPCRDNFTDRATYRFEITSRPGWSAICSGMKQSQILNEDQSVTSIWTLNQPTPTYLVSVSVAPWHTIERSYQGIDSTYPAIIGFTTQDSASVYEAYEALEDVIPMYERCFGPYKWGRIGYIATPKGSMEHATNIALVSSCMSSMSLPCQSVIAHELAHAWFGNLVCCSASEDMWINEGGATFSEELAREATTDKNTSNQYYQNNLEMVLRSAHHDEGYLALHGVTPTAHTYGTTSYNKGATVWHSLRGYLGDSLFYATMRTFFNNHAFNSVDAYQLCDSLSAISGVDLTDFFNFHVFQPGFIHYHIDSIAFDNHRATVKIRYNTVGNECIVKGHRIPITFFSASLEKHKTWIHFDGRDTTITIQLPFQGTFVILDYDKEISDACTLEEITLANSLPKTLPLTHCKIKSLETGTGNSRIYVTHHWSQPDHNQSNEGIIRYTNRYWVVTGQWAEGSRIQAQFQYSRRTGTSGAGYLDYGFFNDSETLDSIRLMYRYNSSHPWQAISSNHGDNSYEDYFTTDNLVPGEYTLAVVDPLLVNIEDNIPNNSFNSFSIYPNPTTENITINPSNKQKTYKISIFNSNGRRVYRSHKLQGFKSLELGLQKGSYILHIHETNNRIIQTEKIVIQ